MKKLLILLPILMIGMNALQAQKTTVTPKDKVRPTAKFHKGDIEVKAGLGILPTFLKSDGQALTMPIQASLDYRFSSNFSLGAFVGYSSTLGAYDEQLDGSIYQSQSDLMLIGLRPTAHMTRIKNLDVYGGMSLAYNMPTVTTTLLQEPVYHTTNDAITVNPTPYNPNGPKNNIIIGGFVGASFYVTPNFSVFGELGYGTSIALLGLGYKF